jgi:hypothetical protein
MFGRRRNLRKMFETLKTKTDFWHIICNAPDPWKTHAVKRLISHKDLSVDDAWKLLGMVENKNQIQQLLQFLWNLSIENIFDAIRYASKEIKQLAWNFLTENAKYARESVVLDHLVRLVGNNPDYRDVAWKLLLELNPPEVYFEKTLALQDCTELQEIKRQAVKRLKRSERAKNPSKNAKIIVKVANSHKREK